MAVAITEYPVTVDYSLSFEDMIRAAHVAKSDDRITAENFPVAPIGRGKTTVLVVEFDDGSDEEVTKEMERMGLRAANLAELLALAATYSGQLRKYGSIESLALFWLDITFGDFVVLRLEPDEDGASLVLRSADELAIGGCAYAAVRKSASLRDGS